MAGEEDTKEDEDKGPLGGQGNLEGLRELTAWCQHVMGLEGSVETWVREVFKRNAEMVAGWQVSHYPIIVPLSSTTPSSHCTGIWIHARCAQQ